MIAAKGRVKFLKRRYGFNLVPLIGMNGLILYGMIGALFKFGLKHEIYRFNIDLLSGILLINVIPIIVLSGVWSYRIGYDEEKIYVRPLKKFGPYMEMPFREVHIADLKPASDLGQNATSRAAIVLYRDKWDGQEIFALDCNRTNPRQFKDLVRLIHDRCPGTFTEHAQHYLDLPDLNTPHENRAGGFIWWVGN